MLYIKYNKHNKHNKYNKYNKKSDINIITSITNITKYSNYVKKIITIALKIIKNALVLRKNKIDMKEPNVDPKKQYTSLEVTQQLGICRRTLDRYAELGLIKYKVRAAGNKRVYFGQAIIDCYNTML